ncbi:MAG TPA: hypothetical protein VFK47_10620 [Ktedonobacteraceae bacterium]|nr:hypothetical protein [Ktedonobacteraceae bacterium]
MNKSYLHHLYAALRSLKVWYFLVAAAVLAVIAVFSLRQNYVTMVDLRNDVYATDQANGNVEAALQKLRSYVGAHMNTGLARGSDAVYPPIQLKYTYERLQAAEKARVEAASRSIYTDAQKTCEALYPGSFSGGPRVPCIESYVSSHAVQAQVIPDSLYKFDFVSPRWSPDLAGISLLLSVMAIILMAIRLAAGWALKRLTT